MIRASKLPVCRVLKIILFLLLVGAVLLFLRRLTAAQSAAGGARTPPRHGMSRDEAMAILGLDGEQIGDDEVIAAHKRLMQRLHPDKGGSAHLAAQLNEAKLVLLSKPRD